MSNEELKQNLTSSNQWMRLIYMVLFAVLLEIAGFVMLAVVIAQFLFAIVSGGANDNLRRLGDQIASYIYQTLQFLIYNSEEKPFPFSEWPESEEEDLSTYESAEELDGEVIAEEEAEVAEETAAVEAEVEEVEAEEVISETESVLEPEKTEEKPAKRKSAKAKKTEKSEDEAVIELGADAQEDTAEATETASSESEDKPSGEHK
ncbi:DUF4389 domain-containing protein [Microbulbifer mangrovi]|uniref:DUF4389 domain-containing protein n=1 Tax=Microbulbifer mangrovi TaxID=927787 RepID=UPI0009907E3C|nr:DUF4389 domain-containing protein [Microbulbifer mangrovi]